MALSSGVTIDSYGDRITAILYYVGFKLNSELTISSDSIKVDGTAFAAGTTVTVNNKPLTTTTTVPKSTQVVSLDCGPLSELTEIRYFGTDIRAFSINESVPTILDCGTLGMTDQTISFKNPLTRNTTFKVLIAKDEAHSHVREQLTAPTVAGGTITLSQELNDLNCALLFIDGRRLTETTDYMVNSATEIEFVDGYPADTTVDTYYEVAPVQHNHVLEQQSVSGNVPTDRYELNKPYLESQPMLTLTASSLKSRTPAPTRPSCSPLIRSTAHSTRTSTPPRAVSTATFFPTSRKRSGTTGVAWSQPPASATVSTYPLSTWRQTTSRS